MKTKFKTKKLLALVLSLAMLVGMLPMASLTAYANNTPVANVTPQGAGTVSVEPAGNDWKYMATPTEGYTFLRFKYIYDGRSCDTPNNRHNRNHRRST